MKVKLRKRYRPDVEGGLRTEEVVGDAPYPPRHGKPFIMAAPLLKWVVSGLSIHPRL